MKIKMYCASVTNPLINRQIVQLKPVPPAAGSTPEAVTATTLITLTDPADFGAFSSGKTYSVEITEA